MEDRFILQPSQEQGFWVATDKEHGIVIKFEEHKFNDTQKVTLLDGNTFKSADEALKVATYMRELSDWLAKEHYAIAMPDPVYNRKRVGQKLREIRTEQGLTIQQAADRAGITFANLSNIENGKYSVGLDILSKIANALGVEIQLTPTL